MTVMVMRFKGSPATLQKGFDTVSQAIAALGGSPRVITTRTPARLSAPDTIDADASANGNDAGPEVLEPEVEESVAPAPKPKKAAGPKHKYLPDFNLSPAGEPAWTEFAEGKPAEQEQDKFLIASLWLMEQGGADPFTGDHLFTCFRAMNWKTQVDMVQPLRLLKNKKSHYENPSHGKWRLTQIGLDAARKVGKE